MYLLKISASSSFDNLFDIWYSSPKITNKNKQKQLLSGINNRLCNTVSNERKKICKKYPYITSLIWNNVPQNDAERKIQTAPQYSWAEETGI